MAVEGRISSVPAGGGGAAGAKQLYPASSTGSTSITTSDSAPTSGYSFQPVTKAGTYRLTVTGRVVSVTGSPTQVHMRTPTSYALIKVSTGGGKATLVAANTLMASWDKGSVLANTDVFRITYGSFSLAAGDLVTLNGNYSGFLNFRVNPATGAQIGFTFALEEI